MAQNKQLFREDFPTFIEMPTRWMDNDAYGHMNNIVHYALIDTAVTEIGNTSWIYQAGLFREEDELCFALGFFAQVLVDCENRRPTPIPNTMRDALKLIEV
jgi:acyl-CoA thioester hydrolase